MSILNDRKVPEVDPAVLVSKQLVNQAKNTFDNLVSVFNSGSRQFWKNPRATPQQISAALGKDAAEVFALHAKIGALLEQVKPEAIAEGKSVVGEFTVNSDGTVTVPVKAEAPASN